MNAPYHITGITIKEYPPCFRCHEPVFNQPNDDSNINWHPECNELTLRKATSRDAHWIWQLRNSSEVRRNSISSKPIPYQQHVTFFTKHLSEFLILPRNIGYLRIEPNGFISIYLRKAYRGSGTGSLLLARTSGKAIVLLHNTASISSFQKAGWKVRGLYFERRTSQEAL